MAFGPPTRLSWQLGLARKRSLHFGTYPRSESQGARVLSTSTDEIVYPGDLLWAAWETLITLAVGGAPLYPSISAVYAGLPN